MSAPVGIECYPFGLTLANRIARREPRPDGASTKHLLRRVGGERPWSIRWRPRNRPAYHRLS
jgi:hypothetical protein